MRGFLSLADLPGDELGRVLTLAEDMRFEPARHAGSLAGRRIGLVFLNPSLRTKASMELAAQTLGAHYVTLTSGSGTWALETANGVVMDGDRAEHVVDAVRVLSEMFDLIGIRCFAGLRDVTEDWTEPTLRTVAANATVPVVNMESAFDHPLQALADLMTLRHRHGEDLRGLPVTLSWAPHPKPLPLAVPAAFLRAMGRVGAQVRVATPPEFALPEYLLDEVRGFGADVSVHHDQVEAVHGSRVVYAKSWGAPALLGDRDAEHAARSRHAHWTIDERLMDQADDATFLHCLPIRRNVVATDGVLDGPWSRVYRQAGNRLHTARAVLHHLLAGSPSESVT